MRTKSDENKVTYLATEVSWGSSWVNINDGERYRLAADTRGTTNKTYRKVLADSPILGGNYLIHAVPDMCTEQVQVWVHGNSQTNLAENYFALLELFEQMSYRIRWTLDEYRETWNCQLADVSTSRGHIWTHSAMAQATFTVPRYPDVTREQI